LAQLAAVERQVPSLAPSAIVVSGDLTQRARHGEFIAARRFLDRLAGTAPVLTLPGNHDVQWWETPYWILGRKRLYVKYRRWISAELTPTLRIPGAIVATLLTSHGVSGPSTSLNPNDTAVKGHLPASEVARVAGIFASAPPALARVVVVHHNILRGKLSQRMGLSRWKRAQERLARLAPDLIMYGHDHEEAAAQLEGKAVVSAASTLTHRTRGKRPSTFNVVTIDAKMIAVQYWRWQGERGEFAASDRFGFPRRQDGDTVPVPRPYI
jgi:3',5'-cyclic AMP phosphodiesterase CpdA